MSDNDESSKATQEVAKTARKALETSEKVGGFLADLIGQPLKDGVGILGDRIKYLRWERQVRLIDRYAEVCENRKLEGNRKNIPLKLALPAIESASIEEEDELQDLWARLLASSSDPRYSVHPAFADIIRQLQSIDVKYLDLLYVSFNEQSRPYWIEEKNSHFEADVSAYFEPQTVGGVSPTDFLFPVSDVAERLGISDLAMRVSSDNLARMSLINHNSFMGENVSLSSLGYLFVLACVCEETTRSRDDDRKHKPTYFKKDSSRACKTQGADDGDQNK